MIAGIPAQQLRHTRAGQEWIEERRQEGEAIGVARREARGEAPSRDAQATVVTLRQLTRRCGPLSEGDMQRIQALPVLQLDALAEALLEFRGSADLQAWLADHDG